jgi:hypothetical protein
MISIVRVRARIDDEIEVEHEESLSEEEVCDLANADWQFVEASEWESEIVSERL